MTASPQPAAAPPPPIRGSHLLLAGLACTALVIYASLIPLSFHPVSFDDAVQRFRNAPMYSLGVTRRADLLANVVLFIPLGFLWMGAQDIDRRRRGSALLLAPQTAALLALLAVAIEFAQVWFPPRTVSQNDILAEIVGSVLGMMAWFAGGHATIRWLAGLRDPRDPARPRRRLLQAYTLALLLFTLAPFDLTLHVSELVRKAHEGRLVLIPFSRGWGDPLSTLVAVVKHVVVFIPVGVMLRMGWERDPGRTRTLGRATLIGLGLAMGIEAAQLFIFTTRADVTEGLLSAAGGLLGAALAPALLCPSAGRLALGDALAPPRRRRLAWAVAAPGGVAVALLLWLPLRFTWDWDVITAHAHYLVSWPFQLYYYSGEWTSLVKVVYLAALFAPLGALLRWGEGPTPRRTAPWLMLAAAAGLGLTIELGQAAVVRHHALQPSQRQASQPLDFAPPPVRLTDAQTRTAQWLLVGPTPDATDLLAYVAGAGAGWVVLGVFLAKSAATA